MELKTLVKNLCILLTLILLYSLKTLKGEEADMTPLLKELSEKIDQTKKELEAEEKKEKRPYKLLAFFDFDGTIIKGDITEGLPTTTKESGFKGLEELATVKGLSVLYQGEKGFQDYLKKYEELLVSDDEASVRLCNDNVEPPKNSPLQKNIPPLQKLIRNYFESTLKNYYFVSSLQFLKVLSEKGVEVYIISASPHLFVQEAATTIGLSKDHLSGISKEDPIFNFKEGKIKKLQFIRDEWHKKGYKTAVVAGFGNSWKSDGPFLHEITKQKGLSVMINGGEKPKDRPYHFKEITLTKIQKN